ncbi:general substrate transporter [Pseudomassariella vexata]|uniref:General substrate transporter n=1 Tax=Pseudomassariella vexata TaxID=1141098 RepID=A0A1Y2DQB7_9PEZI|nr:general substrate transporter [Pseudomassariella vexata]ORY61488.1 general substrate transporter [Pseudomassariella vexata]
MAVFTKATIRLHLLCIFFAVGSFVWGYNVGILSSVLVHPGFDAEMGKLTASRKGVITAIYYLGTWTSYIFLSHPASDFFGRRYAALIGTATIAVGTAFEAGARSPGAYAMMIIGRIICGLGVAIVSTSVPLYQSEVSPAGQRGKYVVLNHVGFVAGLAAGFWVGYGITFWGESPHDNYVSWRFSVAIVLVPCLIFGVGLPFLPETPRWLIKHGHYDRAQRSLHWLREGSFTNAQMEIELNSIRDTVEAYKTSGHNWLSLFKERSLFNRLWRAALLQFMAQMCGATAMKYYLPTLFLKLGLGRRMSLLAGGIESTLKIGMTVIEMLLIDRLGRRTTLLAGCTAMSAGMLINGVLGEAYPNNQNRASDIVCITFIFIYAIGYSLSFGPSAWVYGSEIFPTSVRARGLNFSASVGAIGSVVVAQVWPVGIDQIGSRIYFFFFAVNVVCVPIIYLLYPETKGRALEDMESLFSRGTMRRNSEASDLHDDTALPKTNPHSV